MKNLSMKKLLSLLLVLAMLVSLFPAALAEGENAASDAIITADGILEDDYEEPAGIPELEGIPEGTEPEEEPSEGVPADEALTEPPAEEPAEPTEELGELPEEPDEVPEAPAEEPEEEPAEESDGEAKEEKDPEAGEAPEEDDEEAEQTPEDSEEAIRVEFVSAQDITLTVSDGEAVIAPVEEEEDVPAEMAKDAEAPEGMEETASVFRAVYLLTPGVYTWTATAEGFRAKENVPLEVAAGSEPVTVTVSLKEALPYGFKGLPEDYELSEEQLEEKRVLTDEGIFAAVQSGEGDYVEGEVLFSAESEEYARMVAEAYNAELTEFSDFMGILQLTENTVAEAVECAADMELPLPAVEPNWITVMDPPIPSAGVELDAQTQAAYKGLMWQDWIDNTAWPDELMSDPGGAYQYQHDVVHSYGAWGVTTGKSNIVVAVVDTGVDYDHTDLDGKVYKGYDYVGDDSDPKDENGHGTHVAGIIAAKMGNGEGGAGIAPGVSILAVRVCDEDGRYNHADLAKGINYVVNAKVNNSIDVSIINLSLNSWYYSRAVENALKRAYNADITVIVSMGNDASNFKTFPAASDYVIAVGATDISGTRAPYSNYGPWCDISAPGSAIWSTVPGGYDCWDGTSMAAPVVSGVAALYMSRYGRTKPDAMKKALTKAVNKGVESGMGSGVIDAAMLFGATKGGAYSKVFNANNEVITGNSVPANGYIQLESGSGDTSEASRFLYSTDGQNPAVRDGAVIHGSDVRELGRYDAEKGCFVLPLESFTPGQTVEFRFMELNGFGAAGEVSQLELVITEAETADQEKTVQRAKVGSIVLTGELPVFAVGTTTVLPVEVRDTEGQVLSLKDAAITWTSSDPSVATVRMILNEETGEYEVLVSAKKAGNFQLSGRSGDEDGEKIEIQASAQILVTDITITGQTVIAPGATATYKVSSILPKNAKNKKVEWIVESSEDEYPPEGVTFNSATGKVSVASWVKTGTCFFVWAVSLDGNAESDWLYVMVDNKAGSVGLMLNEEVELKNNATINLLNVDLPGTENVNERRAWLDAWRIAGAKTGGISDRWAGIQWTSSNAAVVSITDDDSEGGIEITANKPGTATLTAKALDGSNKTAKVKVKVNVPVSAVSVVSQTKGTVGSFDTHPIAFGKSVKNKAILSETYGVPSVKKVTWDYYAGWSDDGFEYDGELTKYLKSNKLVTVSNGTLTVKSGAEKKGQFAICVTATAQDGSGNTGAIYYQTVRLVNDIKFWVQDYRGYWYKTKKVTIGLYSDDVSGGEYDTSLNSEMDLRIEGTSKDGKVIKTDYNVTSSRPDVVSAKVVWGNGNPYLIIIKNPLAKTGSATLTVKAMDGSNKSASITVQVDKSSNIMFWPSK